MKLITDKGVLSTISRETTLQEVMELNLIPKLKAALETAWTGGYGLAAIQISIPIRAAWYKWQGKDEIGQ